MKFLIDANLPYKLAIHLKNKDFDIIHTDDLPGKERTPDNEIRKISTEQDRIIVTKDADFLDSHLILGVPHKLLYISTGNIINKDLVGLIEKYFSQIVLLFNQFDLIELSNEQIIAHEK